jgi:hypothetical protein
MSDTKEGCAAASTKVESPAELGRRIVHHIVGAATTKKSKMAKKIRWQVDVPPVVHAGHEWEEFINAIQSPHPKWRIQVQQVNTDGLDHNKLRLVIATM